MPLPEVFKEIAPAPWTVIPTSPSVNVCYMAEDSRPLPVCSMPWATEELTADQSIAYAELIARAPDHALLLAATIKSLVHFRGGLGPVVIDVYGEPKLFPYTLDPFGCPILSDECRAAIIAALEGQA